MQDKLFYITCIKLVLQKDLMQRIGGNRCHTGHQDVYKARVLTLSLRLRGDP